MRTWGELARTSRELLLQSAAWSARRGSWSGRAAMPSSGRGRPQAAWPSCASRRGG
jgi:hypothetical protein